MKSNDLKILICVLLFMILPELHLLLNNYPAYEIDWFWLVNKTQDIQWYIKDNLDILALILLSIGFYIALPTSLKPIGFALILINIAKIPLYWVFYLQFDWVINIIIFTVFYIKYLIK